MTQSQLVLVAKISNQSIGMAVSELVVVFQNGNHFHVRLGFVFSKKLEPVLNGFSVLRLNRGEVALGAFYLFAHMAKIHQRVVLGLSFA